MGLTLSLRNTPSWALYWMGTYSPTGNWADQVISPVLPIGTPWQDFSVAPADANWQGFNLMVTNLNDFTSPLLQIEQREPRGAITQGTVYLYDWATGKFTPPLGGGGIPKEWLIGGGILLGGLLLMGMLKKK